MKTMAMTANANGHWRATVLVKNCLAFGVSGSKKRAKSNKTIPNAQTGSEEGSGKANIVVLEGEQEESGKGSDSPHGHVGDEAAGEGVAMDHDGTVPEDHEEGEGQRHDRDGEVDQPRSIGVAEVDGSQIKEVDDEGDFGEDGEATDPKHHAN